MEGCSRCIPPPPLPQLQPRLTHHDREDQSHDVDRVRGAEAGNDGEPQVVSGHGRVLLGLVIFCVGLRAAVRRLFEVRLGAVLRHGESRGKRAGKARAGTRAALSAS